MNSLINEFVKIGSNVKIWNFCNLYGTGENVVTIGNNTQIGSFTEIKPGVFIGKYCRIQSYVFISDFTNIGNYVFIGPHVSILNDKHPTSIKTINKTWKLNPCIINDYVSIGAGAVIGPGVKIGKYSVIGMGAVVIKNISNFEIVAGNPARVIGKTTDYKYRNLF